MPTITTKDDTQISYKDWGSGPPVVFSHGWPLSADVWEDQMPPRATPCGLTCSTARRSRLATGLP